jgi:hypothetical protein
MTRVIGCTDRTRRSWRFPVTERHEVLGLAQAIARVLPVNIAVTRSGYSNIWNDQVVLEFDETPLCLATSSHG